MAMKNPVHPGRVVRELCLEPLGLTVTAAAAGLGVSRQALNNLLNEKADLSAEMAVRLEMGFGSKAATWLAMQQAYDLAATYKRMRGVRIKRPRGPGRSAAA
jgi:antitoxin HigA-1